MICNIKRRPAGGIKVGTLAVGEIVQIAVSGVMTNFIVANQGIPADTGTGYDGSYDASCDGTWMIAEALMDGVTVAYSTDVFTDDLTRWFSAKLDEKTLAAIRQATYPTYWSNGVSTTTGKIVRPGVRELNYRWSYRGSTYDGAPLEYFLTHSATYPATGSGSETDYWTRSYSPADSSNGIYISSSGMAQQGRSSKARARPLFIFEPDTLVKKVSDGVYQLA